jgi:hypothetical protein
MKKITLLLFTLLFCTTHSHAQNEVTTITSKNQNHYISTSIDYPIAGIYLYESKTEPVVQLNADGTGIFQFQDLSKKNISWGIECSEIGIPIFKEGFNSASYSLWYKSNDNEINSETSENNNWILVQFSIHFNKKKMYIMGERVKDYTDSLD